MKKTTILYILLLFAGTQHTEAQCNRPISQYFMAMNHYNPAVAGNGEELSILGLYRKQWADYANAPQSFFVAADMPLRNGKTRHGIGIVAFTERTELFRNMHFAGQYAYKQNLFGGTLSIGVQAGVVNSSVENSSTTQERNVRLDLNMGLYYTHKRFYAGLGVTHVTQPEFQLDEKRDTLISRAFNFTGGYAVQMQNPLWELQPSLFLKTDGQNTQVDVTGRAIYKKRFSGGVAWRVNEAVILLLGASFGGFQAGYAYDYPTTASWKGRNGSHELILRYRLKLKNVQTRKNKYKSVRIL